MFRCAALRYTDHNRNRPQKYAALRKPSQILPYDIETAASLRWTQSTDVQSHKISPIILAFFVICIKTMLACETVQRRRKDDGEMVRYSLLEMARKDWRKPPTEVQSLQSVFWLKFEPGSSGVNSNGIDTTPAILPNSW